MIRSCLPAPRACHTLPFGGKAGKTRRFVNLYLSAGGIYYTEFTIVNSGARVAEGLCVRLQIGEDEFESHPGLSRKP